MIAQADALIMYHTGQDPDELSDEDWAMTFKSLEWARDQEHKKSQQPP